MALIPYGLSGCDQAASLIGERSAEKLVVLASKAYSAGDYRKAIDYSQVTSSLPSEDRYLLFIIAARSYAMLGEVDQAIYFLTMASRLPGFMSSSVMVDPAFDAISTDIRFVQFLAGITSLSPQPRSTTASNIAPEVSISAKSGADVSVRLGDGSSAATSGDVSVRIVK